MSQMEQKNLKLEASLKESETAKDKMEWQLDEIKEVEAT